MLLGESPIALVGRKGELDRLSVYVNELVTGRGRAVLVEGEPGIGKSALLKAVCDDAQRLGCRVVWAAADELGQVFALLPLIEALGRSDPGWRSEIQGILRAANNRRVVGLMRWSPPLNGCWLRWTSCAGCRLWCWSLMICSGPMPPP